MNMQNSQGPGQPWQNQNPGQAGAPYGGQPPFGQGYHGANQPPYGQPPYGQGGYAPYPPKQPGKGLGIAAMVCGILSIVFIFFSLLLAIGCGIAGLVMGIVGRKRNRKDGMALAGIITSSIGIGLCVLLFILAIALVGIVFSSYAEYDYYLNAVKLVVPYL